jgi:hypothetical protein
LKKREFDLPAGSVAFQKQRAEEKYDIKTSRLREEVSVNNRYTLILRLQHNQPWFKKFKNDYFRKTDFNCSTCELIYFIISFIG